MKRRELKSGDLVRVYGYDNEGYYWDNEKAAVHSVGERINVLGTYNCVGNISKVHRNQCTPIRIVKKKRRELWVNKSGILYKDGGG